MAHAAVDQCLGFAVSQMSVKTKDKDLRDFFMGNDVLCRDAKIIYDRCVVNTPRCVVNGPRGRFPFVAVGHVLYWLAGSDSPVGGVL
jgi:hypothetical protein